ncbi:MAG: hypothetical protein ABI411_01550 [Tahibacter sp.]
MARNTTNDTSRGLADGRREFLRKSSSLALAACAVGASPLSWAVGVKPGLPPAGSKVTLLRWDAARFLSDLSHLRAGWMEPCASLAGVPYPVSLPASLSAVPTTTSTEAAKPVHVRLLGYDGRCGIASMRLDVMFNSLRTGGDPYGWADVRSDKLISVPSSLTAYASGGSLQMQLSIGASGRGGQIPLQLPSADGVYIALVNGVSAAPPITDLAFAEQNGGGYHRRLTTYDGRPVDTLGYFVFVVQSA